MVIFCPDCYVNISVAVAGSSALVVILSSTESRQNTLNRNNAKIISKQHKTNIKQ